MRNSPFFRFGRVATEIVPSFTNAYVSTLNGNALVRKTPGNAFVSNINGNSLVRRTAANAHVSAINGHVLLRQTDLIFLDSHSIASTGARSATAGYRINATGYVDTLVNGSSTAQETWLLGGSASDYEARLTTNSLVNTATTTGTFDSWVDLTNTATWTWGITTRRYYFEGDYTIEIRDKATSTVQASGNIFVVVYTDGATIP